MVLFLAFAIAIANRRHAPEIKPIFVLSRLNYFDYLQGLETTSVKDLVSSIYTLTVHIYSGPPPCHIYPIKEIPEYRSF
jgi:hypothetical protein